MSYTNQICGVKVIKKWKNIFNKDCMYILLNVIDNMKSNWTYIPLTHPLKVITIAIQTRVNLHNFEHRMRNFPSLSYTNKIYGVRVIKKWKSIFNRDHMCILLNIVNNMENNWAYIPLIHPLKVVTIPIQIRVNLHNFEDRTRNFLSLSCTNRICGVKIIKKWKYISNKD